MCELTIRIVLSVYSSIKHIERAFIWFSSAAVEYPLFVSSLQASSHTHAHIPSERLKLLV